MAQFLRNISILILNMKATSKKLKQQSLLLLFSLFLTSSLPRSLTQFLSLKIFLSFYHNSLSLSPLSFSLSLSPPLSFTRNLSLSFSFIARLRSHPSSFGHMAQRKKGEEGGKKVMKRISWLNFRVVDKQDDDYDGHSQIGFVLIIS